MTPDKYSRVIEPIWMLWLDRLIEPGLRDGRSWWEASLEFSRAAAENWKDGCSRHGHEVFMEQRDHARGAVR